MGSQRQAPLPRRHTNTRAEQRIANRNRLLFARDLAVGTLALFIMPVITPALAEWITK